MKSKTKLLVFIFSLLGSVAAYTFFHSRETGLCNIYCGDLIETLQNTLLFFPIILLFSVITYKLPQHYFFAWWTFAKFSIPLVLVGSLLINLGILHSSPGTWQEMFDLPAIILLYVLFILGSLIQIIRGYYQK